MALQTSAAASKESAKKNNYSMSKSKIATETRIRYNQKMIDRYTSIMHTIIFGGLGITIGATISVEVTGIPNNIALITSVITFCAAGFTLLAITHREEEIIYDKMILAQKPSKYNSSISFE